jgi:hypothetical protein
VATCTVSQPETSELEFVATLGAARTAPIIGAGEPL